MRKNKNIKIMLISFHDTEEKDDCKYSLASLRLAAYIQNNQDINITIFPFDIGNMDESKKSFIEKVNGDSYDLVGISAYIWTWEIAKQLSLNIKRKNNISILVGGPEVLNRKKNDWMGDEIFVYGEGEEFLNEICKMKLDLLSSQQILARKKIGNAVFNDDYYTVLSKEALVYKNPAFTSDFFEKLHLDFRKSEYVYYETTRGCPYNCGYCGHKTRSKTASYDDLFIQREIQYIGKQKIKKVFIIDPILGGTPKRGKFILENFMKYSPETRIIAYLRPEYIDDEYLKILNCSNIEELRIGIQTLNKDVPQWIRSNSIYHIKNLLPQLNKMGIGWRAELIIGLPGDTMQGLQNSIKFMIDEIHPSYIYAYHLTVLKETRLYDLVNSKDEWIKVDPRNSKVSECYSYSKKTLGEMLCFSNRITSLYNSYTYINGKKTYNESGGYDELIKEIEMEKKYI